MRAAMSMCWVLLAARSRWGAPRSLARAQAIYSWPSGIRPAAALCGRCGRGGAAPDQATALAVNGTSLYLTGSYRGANAAFGPTTLPDAGNAADVFVAKLTDAGSSASFTWALAGGGAGTELGSKLAVLGNAVYVGGTFSSATVSFGSTTLVSAGNLDVFLAKLTDNGSTAGFSWVEPLPYNSANKEELAALVASSAGVYIAGYYNFYYAPIGVGNVIYSNFLTKVVDNGSSASYGWRQTVPDMVSDLAVNGANLYVAGIFRNSAAFGSTILTGPPQGPAANGACEAYVAKLVDAGTTSSYAWAKQTVNANFSTPNINSLAVRGADVYATGYSGSSTSVLGSAALPAGSFVAKLADAGSSASAAWVLQAGGNGFTPSALATSGTAVYVAGTMGPQTNFGNIVLTNAPANLYEPFLAAITDVALPARSSALLVDLSLYPNPAHATATVRVPAGNIPATLTLLDALGRPVRTQAAAPGTDCPLGLAGLAPGVYALRVQAGEALAVRQLVVE
ncbi:MAG: T9SS type A sorting domain-containing protein [Hymenobacter sp.]|nr:MAG: T9SS type A sorting domain-containing protein [Hymenobacter sp.]